MAYVEMRARHVMDAAEKGARDAVLRAALTVADEAKRSMRPYPGRGQADRSAHRGEPPWVQSGDLQSSITVFLAVGERKPEARVFPDETYGHILESTSHPFLAPALEKTHGGFISEFRGMFNRGGW